MNIKDLMFKLIVLNTGEVQRFKFSDLTADDYGIWLGGIQVSGNGVCYSWEDNDYINPDILIELDNNLK